MTRPNSFLFATAAGVSLAMVPGLAWRATADDSAARLPDVVVVAQRVAAPAQGLPVSVTAVDRDGMAAADLRTVKDAALHAPNVTLVDFTTRLLSMPYVRGIGSSPSNPAVTTYLDGVPQLHGYSANRELLDIGHLEFVRGAQGALYGRNTLGGVIHVVSRPPTAAWRGDLDAGFGNHGARDSRFSASGPLVPERLLLGLAAGYAARDGFTANDVTGNDVDHRGALFGKLHLHWTPMAPWSARLIVSGERDRDGDYALGDLAAIRQRPHRVQRDFVGFVDRDLWSPTLIVERRGEALDLTLTTGLVRWRARSATDLDYSPMPAVVRTSRQQSVQFTQEWRLASPSAASLAVSDDVALKWQAGLFFFTQDYKEDSVNAYAPFVLGPLVPFPVHQTSPRARLEDIGGGAYAQTTLLIRETLDIGLGLRGDGERKKARMEQHFTPAIAPGTARDERRSFSQVSPQLSVAWHLAPGRMLYGTASRGYRAGGFNPASPAGREAYDEETSWNYEVGAKTAWLDGRLTVNLAAFHMVWRDLQLNLPVGQSYYIANAGDARSQGAELDVLTRPLPGWDIFGSLGGTNAQFASGATSVRTDPFGVNTTVDVGGHRLIYAPEFTASIGTQVTWTLGARLDAFLRADLVRTGRYAYNPANTDGQDAYSLVNLRVGLRTPRWFAELWMKNALDTAYVPVAFEFPNFQSGMLGENGAPRTFGVRAGLSF